MATPRDIEARRFFRVANQRLEDGRLLLDRLQRANASVYLTGYAVECILKALLITVSPASERKATTAMFRGAIAHDLLWLRERLGERAVRMPPEIASELMLLSTWSTDLRYEPGPGDSEEAGQFLKSAAIVVRWASERL